MVHFTSCLTWVKLLQWRGYWLKMDIVIQNCEDFTDRLNILCLEMLDTFYGIKKCDLLENRIDVLPLTLYTLRLEKQKEVIERFVTLLAEKKVIMKCYFITLANESQ